MSMKLGNFIYNSIPLRLSDRYCQELDIYSEVKKLVGQLSIKSSAARNNSDSVTKRSQIVYDIFPAHPTTHHKDEETTGMVMARFLKPLPPQSLRHVRDHSYRFSQIKFYSDKKIVLLHMKVIQPN